MDILESSESFGRALQEALEGSRAAQGAIKDAIVGVQTGRITEAAVSDNMTKWFNRIIQPAFEDSYAELPETVEKYSSEEQLNDFRPVQLMELYPETKGILAENGGHIVPNETLPAIPELTPYPTFGYKASGRWVEVPKKHGARVQFSWEAFINDDWGLVERFPSDAARLAKRTKEAAVLGTLFSLNPATPGFNAGVIADANNTVLQARTADDSIIFNDVPKNSPLTLDAINAAIRQVVESRDVHGNPVTCTSFVLLVPTNLGPIARNLVSMTGIERTITAKSGGTLKFNLAAGVTASVEVVESDMVSILGGTTQGATNWLLLPAGGRTTAKRTILRTTLRGYSEPELRVNNVTGASFGGGSLRWTDGSFDNDDAQARVRLITGGAVINFDGIVASTGLGR